MYKLKQKISSAVWYWKHVITVWNCSTIKWLIFLFNKCRCQQYFTNQSYHTYYRSTCFVCKGIGHNNPHNWRSSRFQTKFMTKTDNWFTPFIYNYFVFSCKLCSEHSKLYHVWHRDSYIYFLTTCLLHRCYGYYCLAHGVRIEIIFHSLV